MGSLYKLLLDLGKFIAIVWSINKQTRPFIPLLSFNRLWVLVRLQNSAWDFLGCHFGTGDFLRFRFRPEGFLGVNLCSHSLSPEIQSTPLGAPSLGLYMITKFWLHEAALPR